MAVEAVDRDVQAHVLVIVHPVVVVDVVAVLVVQGAVDVPLAVPDVMDVVELVAEDAVVLV